jgi:hypothetical protein
MSEVINHSDGSSAFLNTAEGVLAQQPAVEVAAVEYVKKDGWPISVSPEEVQGYLDQGYEVATKEEFDTRDSVAAAAPVEPVVPAVETLTPAEVEGEVKAEEIRAEEAAA